MCLVCATGGGDISTGISTILATVTAFSPLIGIFLYRVYKATAIQTYTQKKNWVWWTGGLLAAYTIGVYSIFGAISYAIAPYIESAALSFLYAALFLLPAFWIWFGQRVERYRKKMRRIEITTIGMIASIPYVLAMIVFGLFASSPDYLLNTNDAIHGLNVVYGIFLPLLLLISSANIFIVWMQYRQRRFKNT